METFKVGVAVELFDRASGGMMGLIRKFHEANRATDQLHKNLRMIEMRYAIGGGLERVGLGIAGGLGKAVQAAADLQSALKSVQVAGHYSAKEMDEIQKSVVATSGKVATSATTVARFYATLRSGSILTAQQLQQIGPTMAMFADVMNLGAKHVPFEQSARMGQKFAELYGANDPDSLKKGLDMFYRASKVTIGDPSELLRSATYFAPRGRTLGIDATQQITIAAFLERMGLGSKGGAGFERILSQSLPMGGDLTKFRQGKRGKALAKLGVLDAQGNLAFMDSSGKSDAFKLIESLASARARFITSHGARKGAEEFSGLLGQAYGERGGRVAALLSDPNALENLHKLMAELSQSKGITDDQAEYMKTFNGQMQVFKTNLQSIAATAVLPALNNTILPAIKHLAEKTGEWAQKLTPEKADTIVKVVAAIGGLSIAGGAAIKVKAIVDAFKMFSGTGRGSTPMNPMYVSMVGPGAGGSSGGWLGGIAKAAMLGYGGFKVGQYLGGQVSEGLGLGGSAKLETLKMLQGRAQTQEQKDHLLAAMIHMQGGGDEAAIFGKLQAGHARKAAAAGAAAQIAFGPGSIVVQMLPGQEERQARAAAQKLAQHLAQAGIAAGPAAGIVNSPFLFQGTP